MGAERERFVSGPEFPRTEILRVREKIRGRLPFFIIRDDEKTEEFLRAQKVPGSLVAISSEGDIFYTTFNERSFVKKPELYQSWSKLPRGWSLERMLNSIRIRPISEVVVHKVKKDDGAVEAGIRSMDHVLEKYQAKSQELHHLDIVEEQIERALEVLQQTESVSRDEFLEDFEELYRQTLVLMEKSRFNKSRLSLKKDIERLLREASRGTDKLERRNPTAMLKELEAAGRRISYRRNETDLFVTKFQALRASLVNLRDKDRGILENVEDRLNIQIIGHAVFRNPEKGTTDLQGRILMAKIGRLIYRLEQTSVKNYRSVARQASEELKEAMKAVGRRDYPQAKGILEGVGEKITQVLEKFQNIYPEETPE